MFKSKENRTRILILAMLLLLLMSHWIFYKIGLGVTVKNSVLISEFLLFFAFYAMTLYELPPVFPGLLMLLGCGALVGLYLLTQDYQNQDFLLPLTWFPALLFFLCQQCALRQEKRFCFSSFWSVLMHIYPWVYLGLIVFGCFKLKFKWESDPSTNVNYGSLMLLLLCAVYLLIMRAVPGTPKTSGKQQSPVRSMRSPFLLSAVIMLETIVFLHLYDSTAMSHTVPLLWTLDLLFLKYQNHPLVCAFAKRLREKANVLLQN